MKIDLITSPEAEATLATLASQGFTVPTSITIDIPSLPPDITEVDDEELMELFTRLTAYLDFLSTQVSVAQIAERSAERAVELATANAMASQGKGLASVIKATALSDPTVKNLAYEHEVKYNYKKIIETMASNIERDMNLVSRELTRRTAGGSSMTRTRKFIT